MNSEIKKGREVYSVDIEINGHYDVFGDMARQALIEATAAMTKRFEDRVFNDIYGQVKFPTFESREMRRTREILAGLGT